MIRKTVIYFLFLLLNAFVLQAQQPPFWNEIQNFKKQDSINPPTKNAILFIGSSSFTRWQDVNDYFPGKKIINRGFGGSSLPHLIQYFDAIVKPYKPRQVVIYCGENDLAVDSVKPQQVLERFTQLFAMIRAMDPKVPIAFISIKPSPSRAKLIDAVKWSNQLIRSYLARQSNTTYINVFNDMLVKGKPEPTLFTSDSLHMTKKGYALWQRKIKRHLQ